MKDFCYRHSYHPSHKVGIRMASEPAQDALYDQVARVPGVGATVFDTGQGPVAFTGEHADTIRSAGIPVQFKYIHCTAAIRDGVQDVSTHGPVYMAVDNNGKSFDEMTGMLSRSGVPFSDAKPAKGIYDGYVGDSTVITIEGSHVIDMHKYLRRSHAGFGCAAIMSDNDGTKGFDAAGYNSDADPRLEQSQEQSHLASANDDGVMLSLDPANVEDFLIEDGEPSDQLHTTLVYIAKNDHDIDYNSVMEIAKSLASGIRQNQFEDIKISGMDVFGDDEKEKAHVALVGDSAALKDLHEKAFKMCRDEGFDPQEKYALDRYRPHITLAYKEDGGSVRDLTGTPVTYKGITATIAGEKHYFPFGKISSIVSRPEEMIAKLQELGWSVIHEPTAQRHGNGIQYQIVIGMPVTGESVTLRGATIAEVYAKAIRKATMKNNIHFPRVASQMHHFHGEDAYVNPDDIDLPPNHDIAPHENPLSAEYHGREMKPGMKVPTARKNWMEGDMAMNFNAPSLNPAPPLDTKNGEDPLNYNGLKPYLQDVHRKWWTDDPDEQRKTILNAFRVVLLSPNKEFKFNVVHYQDIADMPAETTAVEYAHRLNSTKLAWNEFRNVRSGKVVKSAGTNGKIDSLTDLLAKEVADRFKFEYKPDDPYATAPANYLATEIVLKWRTFVQTLLKQQAKKSIEGDDEEGSVGTNDNLWDLEKGVSHARKFGENENWVVIGMLTQRYAPAKFEQVMNAKASQNSKKRVREIWTALGMDQIEPFWMGDKAFEGFKFDEKAFEAHKEWSEGILHSVRSNDTEGKRFSLFPSERAREEAGESDRVYDRYGGVMMGHLRQIEKIASHVEDLRLAALKDLKFYNGTGHYFRSVATQYTGPKVASFAWLLLSPNTSELSTNDTHIGRFLTGDHDDPGGLVGNLKVENGKATKNPLVEKMLGHRVGYQTVERMMKEIRDRMGYSWMPLGQFQWLIWDRVRYPNSDQQVHTQHHGIAVKDHVPHYDPSNQFETASAFNKDGGLWSNKPEALKSVMDARTDVLRHMFSADSPLTPNQQKWLHTQMASHEVDPNQYMTEGSPMIQNMVTAAVDETAPEDDKTDQWWDDYVGDDTDHGKIDDDFLTLEPEMVREMGWDQMGDVSDEWMNDDPRNWKQTNRIQNHLTYLSIDEIMGLSKRVSVVANPMMRSLVSDALETMEEFDSVEDAQTYSKILENCLRVYTGDSGLAREAASVFMQRNRVGSSQEAIMNNVKKEWNHSVPFLVSPDGRIVLGNTEDKNHEHIYQRYVHPDVRAEWDRTRQMTAPWNQFEQGRVHFPYSDSPFMSDHAGFDTSAAPGSGYVDKSPRVDFYGLPNSELLGGENVHGIDPRHVIEATGQIMRERRDAGLNVESHPSWDRETTYEDIANPRLYTKSSNEEQKPSHKFVYYNGALDVQDYDHNLRFADMIRALLKEHGKDITDYNIDDNKIASGDIFYNSGNIEIKMESPADEDVQANAISSIHNWAIKLVGDIQPNLEKTAMPAANQWHEFHQDYASPDRRMLEKDPETRFSIQGQESPYWEIDQQALARLYTNRQFPLKNRLLIWLDKGPSGAEFARGGSHRITLNNQMDADTANWTLLHEIQHLYQAEENRQNNRERMHHEYGNPDSYRMLETETDSDAMAHQLVNAGVRLIIPKEVEQPASPYPHQQWGQDASQRLGL